MNRIQFKVRRSLVLYIHAVHGNVVAKTITFEGGCEHDGDLRLVNRIRDNYGALQVCDTMFGWRHIIPSDWTRAAARLACRQLSLGYLSKRVLVYSVIKLFHQNTDASSSTLELMDDVYIRKVTNCSCIENADRLNDCIEDIQSQQRTVITVNCSKKLMFSYICTKTRFYRKW